MLFAHLKRILKVDRLRLRGPSGACDEFTLAAAVQNAKMVGVKRHHYEDEEEFIPLLT